MKNISRRVFIKGLAVAGVAAAASTVLAGCNTNMIPGTDNEGDADVVPTPSNTYTFKDGDNTLVVEAPKFAVDSLASSSENKENVIVFMNVTNNLGDTLTYGSALKTSAISAGYALTITAEAWDNQNRYVDLSSIVGQTGVVNSTSYKEMNPSTQGTLVKNTSIDNGVVTFKELSKDWAKIVITAKLYKANADSQANAAYHYGSVIDETTFTYTNN